LIIHTLATNYGPGEAFALLHNATPQATVLGIQAQELLILEVQPAISESVTEFQQDETVLIVGHEFS